MPFANPFWSALQTKHRHFAISSGNACRYPADIAPFAAVHQPSEEAMGHLAKLLLPGESVWLAGSAYPPVPELVAEETLECLQMLLPAAVAPPPAAQSEIVLLTHANAPEMVALTDIAFPGFFRKRTCEMGAYFGMRAQGELIAMGGERLMFDGYSEISGLCTHPSYRGKGLATQLIWRVVAHQRSQGVSSFLHVTAANRNAIKLYLDLGFKEIGVVTLTRIALATK